MNEQPRPLAHHAVGFYSMIEDRHAGRAPIDLSLNIQRVEIPSYRQEEAHVVPQPAPGAFFRSLMPRLSFY